MAKDKKAKTEKRMSLADAAALGAKSAGDKAKFLGWEKIQREPIYAGRFDNGTIVYRGAKTAWVFGKTA